MQVRDPLPPFPDEVPRRLQEIARRATAKDPAERFRERRGDGVGAAR